MSQRPRPVPRRDAGLRIGGPTEHAASSTDKSGGCDAKRGSRRASWHLPSGFEAVDALFGQDEVVKQIDSQHTAGLGNALREPNVLIARGRIARGMVVSKYDPCGVLKNCSLEYLARMSQGGGQCSDRDDLQSDQDVPGV